MLIQQARGEPQLLYRRHMELVATAALAIAAARSLSAAVPLGVAFACYGALHAAALAICLRPRPSPGRALAFVGGAALLSGALARTGLLAMPLLAGHDVDAAALLVVAASGFAGAVGYGALLWTLLGYRLALRPMVMIAVVSALAACAGLALVRRYPVGGSTWVAVLWWLAFSGGLCVAQQARRARSASGTPGARGASGATERRMP